MVIFSTNQSQPATAMTVMTEYLDYKLKAWHFLDCRNIWLDEFCAISMAFGPTKDCAARLRSIPGGLATWRWSERGSNPIHRPP